MRRELDDPQRINSRHRPRKKLRGLDDFAGHEPRRLLRGNYFWRCFAFGGCDGFRLPVVAIKQRGAGENSHLPVAGALI